VCVVRIIQGSATEAYYSIASDGFVDLEYEEAVSVGEVTSLHDAGVHSIRNGSGTGETLVTLHVYSPPLRAGRRFVGRVSPVPRHRGRAESTPTVAVVGGGFSGSMTAAQLMRQATAPVRVVLVERQGAIGEGVAYATREPAHRLNVPAENMSARPDSPRDFLDWLRAREPGVEAGAFASRQLYADYLRETLQAASRDSVATLDIVFDEVRRLAKTPLGPWMVHLARGASFRADAVVLAIGHNPPSDPVGSRWSGPRGRFLSDPWRPFAVNAIQPDEPVLILGGGLTAVDMVLSLTEHPRSAVISLVSLRGLAPQSHRADPLQPLDLGSWVADRLGQGVTALGLSRAIRALIADAAKSGADWRQVIDGLRPHTPALWRALPWRSRSAFLRHLRPFWEVHRHRMPPEIGERLSALVAEGRVRILAGRIEWAAAESAQVHIRIHSRTEGAPHDLSVGWVVNCTGPRPSNRPESNPAIASLAARGKIRPDPLSLGLETSPGGAVLARDGERLEDLWVVGTLRKPDCWESTAVPELREQTVDVARQVLRWKTRPVVAKGPGAE
jgi:uncharacterized NAD(P)/FAD-binding protein YdhS